MKLGVFAVLFSDLPFEDALDRIVDLGLDAVEIGTGCWPGDAHCKPDVLLSNAARLKAFRQAIDRRGLVISALSCHGNPLHPSARVAKRDHAVFEKTLRLAAKLDVGTVVTFSGCPGSDPSARQPSWIVTPWPPEFAEALEWQWKDEDEFEAMRTAGLFTEDEARSIRAEGEKVVERVESRGWPFNRPWPDWRPDPSWPVPRTADYWTPP